ncbi:hypothetical protein [Halobacillus trueperi]|uniref:NADH:flavin oxidoreductase/NADH oxidase N-terminal domain-containing protein n=1 Tax=Halobacillus trueperi TaxID=156205 RepID=A0A3E0JDQ9_9BACI|nr:hypothetical protein [Halobacillus trueperi]REJ11085.1 hypothetical protein DYE48_01415 [Halobacillus trueperi]
MTNQTTTKPLFENFTSDKLNLPNRTVMAPFIYDKSKLWNDIIKTMNEEDKKRRMNDDQT